MVDSIETFAYIYEVDAGPLKGAIGQAKDLVDTFVKQTTAGLGMVQEYVTTTLSDLLKLGGKTVSLALERLGISVEQQIFALHTAAEAASLLFTAYDAGSKILSTILKKLQGVKDEKGKLIKGQEGLIFGMKKWAYATYQQENRLGSILGIFKTIAKIGGFAVLLGPLLPFLKPLMYLIEAIGSTLEPAMKTIEGMVEASLAPLAVIFQKLAVKVLPYLSAVLDPIVSLLVDGVMMLMDFFDQGYLDDMVGLFKDAVPVIRAIVHGFVDKFLKPVGGKLLDTVVKLFVKLVSLAVEFVKGFDGEKIGKVFDALASVANLLIGEFGKALELFFTELIKQMPEITNLAMKMLDAYVKLLPELTKLIIPMTKLFLLILGKFLIPATVALLEKTVDQLLRLVENSGPYIDKVSASLETMVSWWEKNNDIMGDTIAGVNAILDDVALAVDSVVTAFDRAIGKMVEFFTLLLGLGDKTDAALGWKKMKKFTGGLIDSAWGAITGAASGDYIARPQIRMVGEDGPEWIVPDTPQGIKHYVPQMLSSVDTALPAESASSRRPSRGVGSSALEGLMRESNRLLAQIAEIIQEQNNPDLAGEL